VVRDGFMVRTWMVGVGLDAGEDEGCINRLQKIHIYKIVFQILVLELWPYQVLSLAHLNVRVSHHRP